MAQYPCERHGTRYYGAQQTAYLAVVLNGTSERRRRRLCPGCFSQVMQILTRYSVRVDDEFGARDLDCSNCEGTLARHALFATTYAQGEDRVDWYGRLCDRHAEEAQTELFWSATGP